VTVSPSPTSSVTADRASRSPKDFETPRSSIRGGTAAERTGVGCDADRLVVDGDRNP
jgi:hypothetical protein